MKKKILKSIATVLVGAMLTTGTAFAAGEIKNFSISGGGIVIGGFNNSVTGNFVIPDTMYSCPITQIGDYAFVDASGLESIVIPGTVTSIGTSAFSGCVALKSVEIPGSVTSIGVSAFSGCQNLSAVKMGKGVTTIGNLAFANCKSLASIEIPLSVTSIGEGIFTDCAALRDIYYAGTMEDWNKIAIEPLLNDNLFAANIHYGNETNASASEQKPVNNEISVQVNGVLVTFDQPPVLENGRTLVPLRAIFEALGASIGWDDATKTVTAEKDGIQISLQIGSNQMYVNGMVKTLDVPAQLINSRTLVPVRAISEAFNCRVEWVDTTKTVVITL